MCDIFISHIHEDQKVAQAIGQFLADKLTESQLPSKAKNPPIKVFLSENQFLVRIGDNWLEKIHSALNSAKIVIALFSEDALVRPWIHFEAGGAWFAGKSLMPVCIGSLEPARLPKPYSNIQGCNLHDHLAPYYLYQSVHSAMHPGRICLPPWIPGRSEDAEQPLRKALLDWSNARSQELPSNSSS